MYNKMTVFLDNVEKLVEANYDRNFEVIPKEELDMLADITQSIADIRSILAAQPKEAD